MIKKKPLAIITVGLLLGGIILYNLNSSSKSVKAFSGVDCKQFNLPPDAQIYSVANAPEEKTINLFFTLPNGKEGHLTVPNNTNPFSCQDNQLRGAIVTMQEQINETKKVLCRDVGDVLSGRIKLPPDRADNFNVEFARQFYQTKCGKSSN